MLACLHAAHLYTAQYPWWSLVLPFQTLSGLSAVLSLLLLQSQAPGAAPGAPATPRQLTAKVNVGKAALLLSLLSREDAGSAAPSWQPRLLAEPTPLMELAAAALTGALQLS